MNQIQNKSQYQLYTGNKQNLKNIGISKMLADSSENEDLQKYLNERAYDTASLGETSADEIIAVDTSSQEIDFYRDSEISKRYKE